MGQSSERVDRWVAKPDYCRGRSSSTTFERSCTRSSTTSRPSGEMSKSRMSNSGARLVNCRSAPVSRSMSQRSLMLNISSQDHECPSSRQEGQVPGPTSQGQGWYGVWCGLGRDGLHRKGGADIGSRVDNKATVRRPRRIDRVILNKSSGRAAIDRHAKKVRDAMIVRRRRDRFAVRRPCRISLQIERTTQSPRVRAIGLHHVQQRLPVLPDRERDIPSIGRDRSDHQ